MKPNKKEITIEKKIVIKYWWKCEQISGEIPQLLQDALDEAAEEQIFERIGEGYVAGQLNDYVNIDLPILNLTTPEDGWECHGAWSVEKSNK